MPFAPHSVQAITPCTGTCQPPLDSCLLELKTLLNGHTFASTAPLPPGRPPPRWQSPPRRLSYRSRCLNADWPRPSSSPAPTTIGVGAFPASAFLPYRPRRAADPPPTPRSSGAAVGRNAPLFGAQPPPGRPSNEDKSTSPQGPCAADASPPFAMLPVCGTPRAATGGQDSMPSSRCRRAEV